MKNRNLLFAAFLAVPFFLTSDNVIETDDSEEVVAEEVVAEEEVASSSNLHHNKIFYILKNPLK